MYLTWRAKSLSTQLEVQWAYSGHLVHLQWDTVHALHAIYSGHRSYTVARHSLHTVVTYSVHTVDAHTLYPHCDKATVDLRCVYSVHTVY